GGAQHRRLRGPRRGHRARTAPRPALQARRRRPHAAARPPGPEGRRVHLTVATGGGFILWFGWYGFNPGSTLSAMDFEGIGRVAANTTLAACAAGLSAMFYAYPKTKTWDVSFTVNGFLAGLVAVTCPCYWVSPTGAIMLGGIAGVIVVVAVDVLEALRI